MAVRFILATILVALILTLPCTGQNVTGSLTATIQDQGAASVPGAEVTLTN